MTETARSVAARDVRNRIKERLNAQVTDERLDDLIDSIMDLRRVNRAFCPRCRSKVEVEYPDYKGQTQALAVLLDQGLGKPEQQVAVRGSVTLKAIADMSNEELAAVAEGRELTE